MQLTDKHREYWQKNLRITSILIAIWFVVTFVIGYFARDLTPQRSSACPSRSTWARRARW